MIWTVLCSGPSLDEVSPDGFSPPGPVVAVNTAATGPLPYQYMCALDSPDAWLPWQLDKIPKGTVIWTNESQAANWADYGIVDPHPNRDQDFKKVHAKNSMSDSYNVSSAFVAMARAVSCGASSVQVYGCDMCGEGYAYGTPWSATPHGPVRWESEIPILRYAVDCWDKDGVSFEFHGEWSP